MFVDEDRRAVLEQTSIERERERERHRQTIRVPTLWICQPSRTERERDRGGSDYTALTTLRLNTKRKEMLDRQTGELMTDPLILSHLRTEDWGKLMSISDLTITTLNVKTRTHWLWGGLEQCNYVYEGTTWWQYFWELVEQRKGDDNDCNTGALASGPQPTCCVTLSNMRQPPYAAWKYTSHITNVLLMTNNVHCALFVN